MNIRLQRGKQNNVTLDAISSKSHVHRLLIAAALSDNIEDSCFIQSNIVSDDMKATLRCLSSLGAMIDINEKGFVVRKPVSFKDEVCLNCGESGSTARFLLPVSLLFSNSLKMNGEGKLPERPFGPLNETLRNMGADISSDFLPLCAKGNLAAGEYVIPGDVSSQFISGLLFALPLLNGDSSIVLTTALESKGYVDLTIDVLKEFGVRIDATETGYRIPGGQRYIAPKEIKSEGDWSNGGFLLCAGAVGNGITIKGLNIASPQKDSAVVDILKQFGARVDTDDGSDLRLGENHGFKSGVSVYADKLVHADIDAKDIPDLVPALSVVAAYADGITRFRNVGRLRIKESDRIETISALLHQIGVKAETKEKDGQVDLLVYGKNSEEMNSSSADTIGDLPITINGYNDHRIVMAGAFTALRENQPVVLTGAQAVNKSYPGFFEVCKLMGLSVTEEK